MKVSDKEWVFNTTCLSNFLHKFDMKNLLRLLTSAMLLALSVTIAWGQDCDQLPSPKSNKLVQDFFEKIPDNEEATLEAKLVAYNKATGIQLTVVTLADVGVYEPHPYATQLGECWKVGEKGVDNGAVLLISFNDRGYAIATGRRLEVYLPDNVTRRINDDVVIPNLRAGNHAEALIEGAEAIMKELGTTPWSERERIHAQQEAERRQVIAHFFQVLGIVVLVALLLFLLVATLVLQRKEARLRKASKLNINFDTSAWPAWAKEMLQKIESDCNTASTLLLANCDASIKALNRIGIGKASRLLKEAEAEASKLEEFTSQANAIPGKIQFYQTNADKKCSEVLGEIGKFLKDIKGWVKQGFNFAQSETSFLLNQTAVQNVRTTLESKSADQYKVSYDLAVKMAEKAQKAYDALAIIVALHDEILAGCKTQSSKLEKLLGEQTKVAGLLGQLKSGYPAAVWQKFAEGFASFDTDANSVRQLFVEANKLNGFESQKFNEAKSVYDQGVAKLNAVSNLFASIEGTLKGQQAAEKAYPSAKSDAASAISRAASKCSDSDVESEAKSKLSSARSSFASGEVEAAKGAGKVDWTAALSFMQSAKSQADAAYKQACDDIEEAEEEREAERRRRASSSSSYTSSSWSSGSSGSSGGSFGGFGGGSFGGGGSGGRW